MKDTSFDPFYPTKKQLHELFKKYVKTSKRGINLKPAMKRDYWIEWDRCNTPEKIIDWVHHISEKSFDNQVQCIHDFIDASCEHHNIYFTGEA